MRGFPPAFSLAAGLFVFPSSSFSGPSFFQERLEIPAPLGSPLFNQPDLFESALALEHTLLAATAS